MSEKVHRHLHQNVFPLPPRTFLCRQAYKTTSAGSSDSSYIFPNVAEGAYASFPLSKSSRMRIVVGTSRPSYILRGGSQLGRSYSSKHPKIINIPKSNIYRFGDSNRARPVFRDLDWSVNDDEAWAVVGSGSGEKGMLFQLLLGHLRATPPPPPPGGLFPFLSAHEGHTYDPFTSISFVTFSHSALRSTSGEFYDYTARYGAVRDEDKITLRQSMFPETIPPEKFEVEIPRLKDSQKPTVERTEEEIRLFEDLIDQLELRRLLDLPLIALSNGQTRRARIVKAILKKPQLLLLDEPLTGLDVHTRPILLSTLRSLHASRTPRVMMGLRSQDTIPDWITHLAWVKGGSVLTGPKAEVLDKAGISTTPVHHHPAIPDASQLSKPSDPESADEQNEPVVQLSNITIKYGTRIVLDNLSWTIRRGDRWHLQGSNGSGKTTLLSLITGDHPQSYTQPITSLLLHHPTHGPTPRRKIPTPVIQSVTGVLSPELFDAFPRRANMSVWDAVGTGFDGGFVPRGKEGVGIGVNGVLGEEVVQWRMRRCWEVLENLGPAAWDSEDGLSHVDESPSELTKDFAERKFVDLSVGEQRSVLLMRAIVGRAPLVLLDEVWSGMDERMVESARRYLRSAKGVGKDQAVVVITHWEEEVPWAVEEGLKRVRLDAGTATVM